ncbi:MAG: hypothetical protein KF815_12675, partial [Rhodospirillales bacterium]|nr:hypothetical protein [Rhodospirillales bacterium]
PRRPVNRSLTTLRLFLSALPGAQEADAAISFSHWRRTHVSLDQIVAPAIAPAATLLAIAITLATFAAYWS